MILGKDESCKHQPQLWDFLQKMQTLEAWEIFICGDQIVFFRECFIQLVSLKKSLHVTIYKQQVCVNLNPL